MNEWTVEQLLVGVGHGFGHQSLLLLRFLQFNMQSMNEPVGDGDEVVGVVKVDTGHELGVRVVPRVLCVDGEIATDAECVRLAVLIRFTLAYLTAVTTAQLRDSHVAQVGLFVLTITGTVHDKDAGIRDPLRHRDRLHIVHTVVIEETYLVEVGEHAVWSVNPEEEPGKGKSLMFN